MRSFCILTSWRTVWIVSWEYQLHLKCSVVERGTSCNQEAVNKLANYSQVNVDKFHIYSSIQNSTEVVKRTGSLNICEHFRNIVLIDVDLRDM